MESDAPGSTARRLDKYRHIPRATFPRHRRGVAVLSALSIIAVAGVSFSGFWLLLTHSPDPRLAGTLVRFSIVKVEDQPLSATESGYLQVFSRDLEYAVTEAGQVGPQLFQLGAIVSSSTSRSARGSPVAGLDRVVGLVRPPRWVKRDQVAADHANERTGI